jgi:quinol monooxygenase YgiN
LPGRQQKVGSGGGQPFHLPVPGRAGFRRLIACRDLFPPPRSHPEKPMPTCRSLPLAWTVLALAGACSTAPAADDHPVVALVKSKVKDPARPFALLVTIKAKAGKEKDVEDAFAPCIAATKKEAGCLAYELNRDPDEPTTYLMYEKFKSVSALDEHLKQDHTQKLLKALEALTDGEIKAKVYAVP